MRDTTKLSWNGDRMLARVWHLIRQYELNHGPTPQWVIDDLPIDLQIALLLTTRNLGATLPEDDLVAGEIP